MRFHCGISFSWKTIKKFLFPILIGLLGIFGFNYIYEHKDSIPFHLLTFHESIEVSTYENFTKI